MDQVITNDNIVNLRERGKVSIASATLRKGIMSDDTAKYRINSTDLLDIQVNSTIDIFGKTYRVNNKPEWTKLGDKAYVYDVVFEGVLFDLRKCVFFDTDATGFKTKPEFSLIGNIEFFLGVLNNNLKRLAPNWKIGSFQNSETKTVTFSKDHCLSALQKICQEFDLEFRIDNANNFNVINVGTFGNDLDYVFEYGKGKGLYELVCTNVNENGIINKMYVSGGSENLPTGYRNFSENLKMPAVDFLEDTLSIENMGLKEGFLDLPDIFPTRTGVISAIDILSKSIFYDASMDFDLTEKELDGITTKYLKPDTTAKIHFNTGNLAGYSFDIKKNGYDHAEKKFEIIPYTNDQGLTLPSPDNSAFDLSVGDKYVIIDIFYPEVYITNAENKLLAKAEEQFPLNLQPKVNYKLKVDENFLRSQVDFIEDIPFDLGDSLTVIDDALGVNKKIKIVSFSRDVLSSFSYEIDIADTYEVARASQLILDIIKTTTGIKTQGSQIKKNYQDGYRRLNELKSLTFDPDGYFDSDRIKPLSIETGMLSVGTRSQQLTLEGVVIEPNYTTPNDILFSAGKLIHFSIAETIKEWDFLETIVDGFDPEFPYYVYAKCEKAGIMGEYFVSTAKISFDELPVYYHFLIGVLHKVENGFRFYTPLEGATTINGRYITTGRVQSVDGSTFFDLDIPVISLGENVGMTGLSDNPVKGSVRFWAGAPYSGKETAPWVKRENGVEEEWLDGVMIRRRGIVGADYFDELFNLDGQLAKKTAIVNGKILEEWYSDGVLVYQIGQDGIYFVAEIAESYSLRRFRNLNTNVSTSDLQSFEGDLRTYMWQKTTNPTRFELRGDKDAYLYQAGQNVYSAGNRQYEGYKNTQSKTNNIADGWYAEEQLGDMMADAILDTVRIANVLKLQSGKVVQSGSVQVETNGFTFNQF